MQREPRRSFTDHSQSVVRHHDGACWSLPVEDTFAAPPDSQTTTSIEPVNIFGLNVAGRVIFEGPAHCGAPTGVKLHEYFVTFLGECRTRRRLVLPGPFQSDPEGVIEGLSALYAEAGAPDSPDTFLSDVIRHAANDNSPASDEEA